jgi:hypothetical protein
MTIERWESPKTTAFRAPSERHECDARRVHEGTVGPADSDDPPRLYGAAITRIELVAGRWWAHNEEYSTQVSFCPWCGERLSEDSREIDAAAEQ